MIGMGAKTAMAANRKDAPIIDDNARDLLARTRKLLAMDDGGRKAENPRTFCVCPAASAARRGSQPEQELTQWKSMTR
jgi:hypothetical protein